MKHPHIMKHAAGHALAATLYVGLVVWLMSNVSENSGANETIIAFAMLMLFSVSAAVMASLVFGKPAMWYLDGKKKEAVKLCAATVGFMVAITILAVLLML